MAAMRLLWECSYVATYLYVNNFILQFLLLFLKLAYTEDILGCGGFVKSDIEINFSLVEVKLYTKQGSLKYQTDCAPNNGYYMIPLYDKGHYILKIEPPFGWIFEPNSVELIVDGASDKCSKGEDINFYFKGFSILGKVISLNRKTGPTGLTVILKSADGTILQQALTTTGGNYIFSGVSPGNYSVSTSHPNWTFLRSSVSTTIIKDNGDIGNQLVISGFDVKGKVFSEGEPIKGVRFLLFSAGNSIQGVKNCDATPISEFQAPPKHSFICLVISQNDGSFVFPSLPPAKYLLIPYCKGEYIKFDVAPSQLEFTVNNDSIILKNNFQVQGFSVKGKVLGKGDKGLEGAHILLDGKEEAITAGDGVYHLDNMKTGSFQLQVVKEHVYFQPVTIKITPNSPQLPNIYASSFSLCGNIVISTIPEGLPQTLQKKISIKSLSTQSEFVIGTDKSGDFCSKVTPGKYILKPILTDNEIKAGLRLLPVEKEVFVDYAPVLDVKFLQFIAKVTGTITCVGKCVKNMQVSLYPIDQKENMHLTEVYVQNSKGSFSFENILPGKYQLTILKDDWCWKSVTQNFEVSVKDVNNLAFHQSGYIVTFSTSHTAQMKYKHSSKSEISGIFNLVHGINKFCLEQPGNYIMEPKSCHQFEENLYQFDTFVPSVITLVVVKHEIHILVKSDAAFSMTLQIQSLNIDEEPVIIEPSNITQNIKAKSYITEFFYWAQSGETLQFTPLSKKLLFEPSSEKITVVDNCLSNLVNFEGQQGIFITGHIHPIITGVQIRIKAEVSKETILTETDEKGSYQVGPLHKNERYKVEAERDGFIISLQPGSTYNFKAFKLAEIVVQVNTSDSSPLTGVLLSLSGGVDYRKNSLTNETGSLTFMGLGPGQYFLRPVMKEYHFEPASKMIDVKEGSTSNLKILAKRVAFSCYGVVTSLNGEPEPGILVEAIGQDSCAEKQEEGKTEQDGSYRIRGLEPKCTYNIYVKIGEINQHIERATPKFKIISVEGNDITNNNFIVFRHLNQMDVNGNVIATSDHLSHLKVVLYKGDHLDTPLYTISLAFSSFFHFPSIPLDHNKYLVRLESSLPRNSYEFKTQDYIFNASKTYLHISLEFNPKRKASEQEVGQVSYFALPLTIILLVLIYYYASILPLLSRGIEILQTIILNSNGTLDMGLQDRTNRKKLKARRT